MAPLSFDLINSKVRAALYGMYIGDAISMPVHWYYDKNRIFRDFGKNGITKYEAPMPTFSGSIMNLSNTGGGGRGSDKASIIGDVLVKGKKEFWTRGGSYHYHHGMKPGENTLDTLVARLMLKTMNQEEDLSNPQSLAQKFYSDSDSQKTGGRAHKNGFTSKFLENYVEYLTTKDSHPDTYVATAHRMFFANWVKDKDVFQCADNDGHNTDSVDGVINVGVISMGEIVNRAANGTISNPDLSVKSNPDIKSLIFDSVNLIRQSSALPEFGNAYHDLLMKLIIENKELRPAIIEVVNENKRLLGRSGLSEDLLEQYRYSDANSDPMSACYVASNFPVMLMMAYKYADSVEQAVLACANAGGENVNRGALLGTVMGAAHGMTPELEKLANGLVLKKDLDSEINQFVKPLSAGGKTEL